jgi:hypothetical protein
VQPAGRSQAVVGQHRGVGGRQPEGAAVRVVLDVAGAGQHAAPLAGVALVDAGVVGELGRGERALGQHAEQAEAVADRGHRGRPHAGGVAEDAAEELLDGLLVDGGLGGLFDDAHVSTS